MLKKHTDIIQSVLVALVEETNLETLVPVLLHKNVFNQDMINRILDPSHSEKRQKTDLFVEITSRGPQAFQKLEEALMETNHLSLAQRLRQMDSTPEMPRSQSLNSVGSINSASSGDNDVDGNNSSKKQKHSVAQFTAIRPSSLPQNVSNNVNFHRSRSEPQTHYDPRNKASQDDPDSQTPSPTHICGINQNSHVQISKLPDYMGPLQERLRTSHLGPDDVVVMPNFTERPVIVKTAKEWKAQNSRVPFLHYKMESNPRGYVLVINNIEFQDLPTRSGAHNDEKCVESLFKQLLFQVEVHRNKTKMEMDKIIQDFSKKTEFEHTDCVIVILMSHGQEGDYEEDTEIVGIDGIGLKTKKIVSYFHNDVCQSMIEKPKVFFFQSCRGILTDFGVRRSSFTALDRRTETDGRMLKEGKREFVEFVRSQGDIFIAHPVPPGIGANRDIFDGAWFIQAIVEVFSEHAWDMDLEDMMKMVDQVIKGKNNLITTNFQTVTTKTIGWNKKLFLNPGLYRHPGSGETMRVTRNGSPVPDEEGMDVVDTIGRRKECTKKPDRYTRLKSGHDDENDLKTGCYPKDRCNPC